MSTDSSEHISQMWRYRTKPHTRKNLGHNSSPKSSQPQPSPHSHVKVSSLVNWQTSITQFRLPHLFQSEIWHTNIPVQYHVCLQSWELAYREHATAPFVRPLLNPREHLAPDRVRVDHMQHAGPVGVTRPPGDSYYIKLTEPRKLRCGFYSSSLSLYKNCFPVLIFHKTLFWGRGPIVFTIALISRRLHNV